MRTTDTKPLPAPISLAAFLPASDFAQSIAFYRELGFELMWQDEGLARFQLGTHVFFLQNRYSKAWAEELMLHLHVPAIEPWWQRASALANTGAYPIRLHPPQDQPWGMRDFVLIDPCGVLWRIAENLPETP